ncbi:MAG TPA: ABC transporter transmembrane domain-containing protein, partial [Microlunatus sp.]|nr:ABC transporter transmembrane domain-containing protein [Microlunatus sp.]
MLMRLLRHYLQPYRSMIIATVLLATLGTMGALYLPSLNASIIDDGVATGDTAFIWRTGGIMLAVSAVQIICSIGSVYFGAKTAMAFGRDLRGAIFDRVLTFSARELN